MSCPAVFLDRDGVININHGYVHKPENFDFIEGIFDVAQHAHELGYKLVVITNLAGSILIGDKPSDNQAGIAAGIGRNLLFAADSPTELEGVSYQKIAALRDALPHLVRLSHPRGVQ